MADRLAVVINGTVGLHSPPWSLLVVFANRGHRHMRREWQILTRGQISAGGLPRANPGILIIEPSRRGRYRVEAAVQLRWAVPAGARRLASNETYQYQEFRVGHRAYGLQFHLEITSSMVDGLRPHLPAEIVLSRAGVATIESVGRAVMRRMFAALAT